MKISTRFSARMHTPIFIISYFILYALDFSSAAVPQPSVVYYGLARDPYGWPYQGQNSAVVTLLVNGVERDTCTVDSFLAPSVNYRFTITVGDTSPTGIYNIPTVQVGDRVSFTIRANGTTYPILEDLVIPPIPKSGFLVPIDLTAGHDTDLDGLPDEWEQDLIDHSNGVFQHIIEVHPHDDFDLDGFDNLAEYRSGTIPYWSFDYLYVENIAVAWGHYLGFDFFSVPGISYGVLGTTNLIAPASWKSIAYKLDSNSVPQTARFIGSGYLTTIYIPATNRTAAITIETH